MCIRDSLYYGRAVEMQAVGLLFVWRGLIGPFAHPLFTAMTGIGLGLARQTHRPVVRKVAPFAGITLAILLHALWNLSAPTDAGFLRMYAMVMVPTFVGVLLLVRRSLRQEAAILRRHLQALVEGGVLTRAELDLLCSEPQRVRALARCLLTGGLPAWRERRRFHQLAGDLAFHRWRVARGLTSDEAGDARREAAWLAEVAALAPRVG